MILRDILNASESAYYRECRALGIPVTGVVARRNAKWGHVIIDDDPIYPREVDSRAHGESWELLWGTVSECFDRHPEQMRRKPAAAAFGSGAYLSVYGVPLDDEEIAAIWLRTFDAFRDLCAKATRASY